MGLIDPDTSHWVQLPSNGNFAAIEYFDEKTYFMFLGTNNKNIFDHQAVTGKLIFFK